MWHDTMLAGCRPVWDFSRPHITLKTPSVASLNCCLKHKLKSSRARAVPGGIVQGSNNSSRNDYCDWRSKELRQLSQQGRSSLVSFKSRAKRSPYYFCRGVALGFKTVSILAQESRPVVTVSGSTSSSLAVSLTALATKNDVEVLGFTKSDMGMQGQRHRTQKHDGNLGDDEILRRRRISLANKGKVPWNKGCKHSPETIKRIKEKTSQAMRSPTVMAKLRLNARHPQSDETKVKIRDKLRERWNIKKRIRGYQDLMLKDWRHSLADTARRGGLWEEEMTWNSYNVIKKQMRVEAAAVARAGNAHKKEKGTPRRPGKSREHRQKISDAIKAKWEDPNYQSKVREGMTKNNAKPRKRVEKRRSAGNRGGNRVGNRVTPTGVIKEPLDHGFLTAVMSGEKKRQQRERAAKDLDDDCPSVSAANDKSRAGYRKVDLLKKHIIPAQFLNEDYFPQEEETSAEELSVSAAHSFVDPQADEKISKLKLLQASRFVMDKKRQEATQRAKILMAEAERAVAVLEAAAGTNDSALRSLAEIQRLMAEAAQFIQAADSVNEADDENKFGTGALQRSTMSLHQSSKSQLQITSHGKRVSIYREDGKVMSSSDSEATHDHDQDQYLQPGHEITAGLKTSSTTTLDNAEAMLFRSEVREMAIWDAHHPFTEEPTSKSKVPSILGLLNGRPSRSIGAMKETDSKALCKRWQPTRLGFRGDGCMGCTPSIYRRTDNQ